MDTEKFFLLCVCVSGYNWNLYANMAPIERWSDYIESAGVKHDYWKNLRIGAKTSALLLPLHVYSRRKPMIHVDSNVKSQNVIEERLIE